MKFLIFNLAVAAALVFLFTADKGEVQRVAGRVHDAVGEVKGYARKALDDDRAPAASPAVKAVQAAPPAPVDDRVADEPAAPKAPPLAPDHHSAPPAPAAPLRTAVADAGPATSAIPAPPPGLDPAVAKRRQEVLDGVAAAEPAPAPALEDGTHMMSPSERRKELLSLAEEMELLYARSVGR